VGDIADEIA
jgi:hypothetical protein